MYYPPILSLGMGLFLASLAHTTGWGIPIGGSKKIVDTTLNLLKQYSVEIETGTRITAFSQLPAAASYFFDTNKRNFGQIMGHHLPQRLYKKLLKTKFGPGVFKFSYVLSQPVKWKDPKLNTAAVIHFGGGFPEIKASTQSILMGNHSSNPVIILCQPGNFDSTRSGRNGEQPLWGYVQVPNNSHLDLLDYVTAKIAENSICFRQQILASRGEPAFELENLNENFTGGNISTGSINLTRFLPNFYNWKTINPYKIPIPGVYLCSAATPPGPGVHGMCGYYAAKTALSQQFQLEVSNL